MEAESSVQSQQEHVLGSASEAMAHPLPQIPYYSIEYPGYVRPASTSRAIQMLGGQSSLDNAFKRTTSKADALVELNLNPMNPFAHPVPGELCSTNNILVKVVRKKRKHRPDGQSPANGIIGEYTVEAVGVVPKTVRFRSMVDFQYQPNLSDPITQLRQAMDEMDVDAILNYAVPPERGDYTSPADPPTATPTEADVNIDPQLAAVSAIPDSQTTSVRSNLRLFPPPLFSRQTIPQAYNFKANPASMVSTFVNEETGEEKKRLVNRMRWRGYGPASIMFADTNVPDKPPAVVEEGRKQVNQDLLIKLHAFFLERAIWTRMSLLNQFSPLEAREILNSKLLLPLVCYVFQDGPWRDTLVRLNYDPRVDPNARFFQRLYFRNANHPIARPSVTTRRQERNTTHISQLRAVDQGPEQESERRRSHIFDGRTITKETAAFQLCDITDPMLEQMIRDPDDLRDTCNERDGWYTTRAFERIKTVLRHKFFSLLEGHPATDEDCRALLTASEGSTKTISTTRSQKLRAGKHNMAKGALRPEDAAALRLRATLDRNAKTFTIPGIK